MSSVALRLETRLLAAFAGVLLGCAITALPFAVSKLNYEQLWPVNIVELPGAIVAILADGGNFHTYNPTVLSVANAGIYAVIFYFCLRPKKKRTRTE